MFEDLFSLPDIGVDIYEAFNDIDDTIAELIRPPQEDDPPDVVEACKHNQDFLTGLRELYHSRPYFDKINYCESLINYLVAYACKGEISSKEAASMFRNLAASELGDDTPVGSLARKLALRVLKARECPRPEIALMCQGLPLYRSSLQVQTGFFLYVSLNFDVP